MVKYLNEPETTNELKSHNRKKSIKKKLKISPLNVINRVINSNHIVIPLFLTAIDNKNKEKVKTIYNKNNKNNIEKDIIYVIYNENKLNSERFQFVIENCTDFLKISSSLIKKLIKDNNEELLEILFKNYIRFYDNQFILNLLIYYKNKTPISNFELYSVINNDKYKISIKLDKTFPRYDSSYYLFNACQSGNEAAVKFLLKHGANLAINKGNKNNVTPLFAACQKGHIAVVKYLVEQGADINKENKDGYTPLLIACRNEHITIVKYLVEQGADINKENKDGFTPLLVACHKGYLNVVKYLVEHGADIKKENNEGYTPLYRACFHGHENIVKYLVEQGSNINKDDNVGATPLYRASQNGYIAIVKYLVEQGADINKENQFGETALSISSSYGQSIVVKYLVEKGADIDKKSSIGWTPLLYGLFNSHKEVVNYLIKRKIEALLPSKDFKYDVEKHIIRRITNNYKLDSKQYQSLIEACAPF